jgi:hypothetical protein
MRLGVNQTWLGGMQITCKADGTKEYTNDAAWNVVAADAFDDISFDDTLVKTGRYLAKWGIGYGQAYDYGVLFQDEGSQEGFEVDYEMTTKPLAPDGFNIIGMLLTGLTARARFKPLSFDEETFYSVIRMQGGAAILPGESVSKMKANLEIKSATTGLTVLLNQVGPMEAEQMFGLAEYRQGQIGFASRMTWTAGVVNPLVTITGAT